MSNSVLKTRFTLLNGTQEQWAAKSNAVLLKGEPAIEFIPGPNTENNSTILTQVKIKIGDGVTPYGELPYIADEIAQGLADLVERVVQLENSSAEAGSSEVFQITAEELADITGDTEADKIASFLVDETVYKGNIAIVKKAIAGDSYSYTAYVYTGEVWAAMDGNYNAQNVIFDEDLTYTANIGVKTVPSSGSGKIEASGKSLEEVLKSILAETKNPTTTSPTVTLNSSNIGAKEVGTNIAVAYSFATTAGSYTYGPETGVTFSNASATFNGETKTGTSGTFTSVQVTDSTSLSITGSIEQSAGVIPVNNIGDEYPDGQIKAKTWSGLTKGTLTGYRAWFYGYKAGGSTLDVSAIDSDDIRGLTSKNGSFTTSLATTNMQQMFFAAPQGKVSSVVVEHSVNGAPQTVKKTTVNVKGANNYVTSDAPDGVAYDLFYVSNDNPNSGAATYKITTTLA